MVKIYPYAKIQQRDVWEFERLSVICEGAQRIYVNDVDCRTAKQRFIGRWIETTATDDADDGGERER